MGLRHLALVDSKSLQAVEHSVLFRDPKLIVVPSQNGVERLLASGELLARAEEDGRNTVECGCVNPLGVRKLPVKVRKPVSIVPSAKKLGC